MRGGRGKKARPRKGVFGAARLPVARQYVEPHSRTALLSAGLLLAGAFLAWALYSSFFRHGRFLSSGPLSSNHAVLEQDCASCHGAFQAVANEACSACHEKLGDEVGLYTFTAHYLYRSNDFRQVVPAAEEPPCTACHPEHLGREAEIVRAADERCLGCHDFGSFGGHPEFDFAAEGLADDQGLNFAHIPHVQEVMQEKGLVDLERACLACHLPEADGRGFEPIDFDTSCDACHLTTAARTPRLPIRAGGPPASGVETLAAVRASGAPGTRWAETLSPAEFQEVGDRVAKTVIHHEDPWILHNLRALRSTLFEDAGLADLLQVSPEARPHELRILYEEALATLEDYAEGLRGRPEAAVRAQLAEIDSLLRALRRTLRDPLAPLDESKFLLALERRREGLAPERIEEIETFAHDLAQPCRSCHLLRDATIVRVQQDQKVLHRAEFDHRAHILELRCLDCHTEIPIAEALAAAGVLDAEGDAVVDAEVDTGRDLAAVQNLPRIAACRDCHRPGLVASSCVTCHAFHPDRGRRADLLLYRE